MKYFLLGAFTGSMILYMGYNVVTLRDGDKLCAAHDYPSHQISGGEIYCVKPLGEARVKVRLSSLEAGDWK